MAPIEVINSIGISEVSFDGDFKESSMNDKIAIKKKLPNKIRKGVFRELHEAIIGMYYDVAIVNISTSDLLPICLSGLGTFMVELEDKTVHEVEIFLSVIPTHTGTKILLCSEKHSEDLLRFYVRKYLDGRLDLLEQIESWMIYQTDHWFITPSHWHSLPELPKASLLELILSNHSTLSSECRLSVLDQVRKNAIFEFKMSQEYINDIDGSEARIRKEKGKLAKIN